MLIGESERCVVHVFRNLFSLTVFFGLTVEKKHKARFGRTRAIGKATWHIVMHSVKCAWSRGCVFFLGGAKVSIFMRFVCTCFVASSQEQKDESA